MERAVHHTVVSAAGQVVGGLDWVGWRWLTAIALSCFLPRSDATGGLKNLQLNYLTLTTLLDLLHLYYYDSFASLETG